MAPIVQEWMASRNLLKVSGMAQILIQSDEYGNIEPALGNVVDDLLLIKRPRENFEECHDDMGQG